MILPLNPPVLCEVWDFEDAPGEFVKAFGVLVNPETGDPGGVIVASERKGRFVHYARDSYQFDSEANAALRSVNESEARP